MTILKKAVAATLGQKGLEGPVETAKPQADPKSLEECVRKIREELARSATPDGKVIVNVSWRGAVDAVVHVLTSEECGRVIFRCVPPKK